MLRQPEAREAHPLFITNYPERRSSILALTVPLNDVGINLQGIIGKHLRLLDTQTYEKAFQFVMNVQTLIFPLLRDESLTFTETTVTLPDNSELVQSMLTRLNNSNIPGLQATVEGATLTVKLRVKSPVIE